MALCRELLLETNSVFNDRLVQLEIFRETGSAEFPSALEALQREAAAAPQNLQELATWEMTKMSPAEAIQWLTALPPKTLTNQPAATLVAECDTMLGDWRGLQSFLEPQNWAELEFIRHAFKSRALREQGSADAAKAEWGLALKGANGARQPLVMLLRLAVQWKWLGEAEEILHTIVNQYPSEKWAFDALELDLFQNGRTWALLQLYSQAVERTPSNLNLKNNLAMAALLCGGQRLRPYDLAREVSRRQPDECQLCHHLRLRAASPA